MEWLSELTAFDVIVLTIFFFFLVRGVWVGFIRQISVIISLFFGYVAAARYHAEFYEFVLPFLDNAQVAFLATYILLFAGIYLISSLAGLGLKKVMSITMMGWFDRAMGGIFGALKGLFVCSVLFMMLAAFLSAGNSFLRRSLTFPVLSGSSRLILVFIRDNDLRVGFLPKLPAITPEDLTVKEPLQVPGEAEPAAPEEQAGEPPAAPAADAPESRKSISL